MTKSLYQERYHFAIILEKERKIMRMTGVLKTCEGESECVREREREREWEWERERERERERVLT